MADFVCEGKHVRLRVVRPEDAPHVAAWKRDPVVREMALGRGHETTEEEQLEDVRSALDSESQLYLIVEIAATGIPIGYVRVNWIDDEHRCAWLRFALGEERGRGHGRDALRAFLRHLFGSGVHRVEAEAYAFNRVSRNLMRSLGFVEEGRKREACPTDEGWADIVAFGLLEGDPTVGD